MDILERVLNEKSSELVQVLTVDTGMSRSQAELFLREAGPALIDSYRWQAEGLAPDGLASPTAVRDLLSGISGRALAPKVGMSSERTWDGLRSLVPAVVRSGARTGERGGARGRGVSAEHPRFRYIMRGADASPS